MTTSIKPYAHALASILALTAGALSLTPSDAQACSYAECSSPVQLLPPRAPTPGDLLYFEVLVDDPGVLTLHTEEGVAIDASIRTIGDRRVFAPTGTVPAATTVVLTYTTVCTPDATEKPSSKTYKYETGPAAGVPQLSETSLTIESQTVTAESASVVLRYPQPFPDSASHLTYHRVTVDGRRFSDLREEQVAGALLVQVSANCKNAIPDKDSCNVPYEVKPGKHEVAVETTVVGAEKQPNVAKLSIELTCPPVTDYGDGGALTPFPRLDAGQFIKDAGPRPADGGALTADAGIATDDGGALTMDGGALSTEVSAVHADGGGLPAHGAAEFTPEGCAVGTPGSSSGSSWAVLVAGLALVLRTRSRRYARGLRKS